MKNNNNKEYNLKRYVKGKLDIENGVKIRRVSYTHRKRLNDALSSQDRRVCSVCDTVKPLSDYYSGRYSQCRECHLETMAISQKKSVELMKPHYVAASLRRRKASQDRGLKFYSGTTGYNDTTLELMKIHREKVLKDRELVSRIKALK